MVWISTKKKKTQHQILLFYWLHQLFSLLELVEEHQVEIETIKADYEEQQSEMKVGECCPGTYFSFSEFFFCVCRKLFPSWHGPPFYKMGSNLNKIFLLFCFCIIFLVVGLKEFKIQFLLSVSTPELPEVINMLLLPMTSIHYPADRWWEYSN